MKYKLPLIMLPLLASCGSSTPATYADAISSFEAKQYHDARIELMNLVQQQPADGKIRLLQAKNFIALGDGIAAQAALEQAIERGIALDGTDLLKAEALLLQNRADDALEIMDKSEAVASAELYRLRAAGSIMRNDEESAIQALDKGLQIDPENIGVLAIKARMLMNDGAITKAETIATQMVEIDPAAIDSLLINGDIASRRNDWNAALKWYENAQKTFPHNLAAQIGGIAALGDLDRLDEMEDRLSALLKTNPKNDILIFLSAKLQAKKGDWRSVSSLISQIDGKLSDKTEVMILAGETAIQLKNFEAARLNLSRALAAQPDNARALLYLAIAYEGLGDLASAQATLRPVTEQKTASRESLMVMARLEQKRGGEYAKNYVERAKFPNPEILAQKLVSADLLLRTARWPAAVKEYRELKKLTGAADAIIMNNLAWSLFKTNQLDEATDAAETAYQLAPQNAAVVDSYGWIMFKSGSDNSKALTLIRKAISLKPDNGNFRWHLVQILEHNGDKAEAKQQARKLLSDPKFKADQAFQQTYARL